MLEEILLLAIAGSRMYSYPLRIFYNGPAVWLVGVCVAVAWFLQVLADD